MSTMRSGPIRYLGRTSRQDAALDELTALCSDRRLGDRNVAIVAASADGKLHPATQPDGLLAKPLDAHIASRGTLCRDLSRPHC
jgi:hypothetical protein